MKPIGWIPYFVAALSSRRRARSRTSSSSNATWLNLARAFRTCDASWIGRRRRACESMYAKAVSGSCARSFARSGGMVTSSQELPARTARAVATALQWLTSEHGRPRAPIRRDGASKDETEELGSYERCAGPASLDLLLFQRLSERGQHTHPSTSRRELATGSGRRRR